MEKLVGGRLYESWEECHRERFVDDEDAWGSYEAISRGRRAERPATTWEQELRALQWVYYVEKIWPFVIGICVCFWSVSLMRQVWDAMEDGRAFAMEWGVKLLLMADVYCGDDVRRHVARAVVGVDGFARDMVGYDRAWKGVRLVAQFLVIVIFIRVLLRSGVAMRK